MSEILNIERIQSLALKQTSAMAKGRNRKGSRDDGRI